MAVRHTGGTCGLACTAAETAIEMELRVRVVERERAVREALHQDDATARRVVLVREREVGGAGLEAEAAMDAKFRPRERDCGSPDP
jgi:hypothetical protein